MKNTDQWFPTRIGTTSYAGEYAKKSNDEYYPHGYGVEFVPSPLRVDYKGQYKLGKKDGNGIYPGYPGAGIIYQGQYAGGNEGPYGVIFYIDDRAFPTRHVGDKYEGETSGLYFLFDGYGVLTFANGERYEGSFKAGETDGYGVYIRANGVKKEGYFKPWTIEDLNAPPVMNIN